MSRASWSQTVLLACLSVAIPAATSDAAQKSGTFASPLAWEKGSSEGPARFAFAAVWLPSRDSVLVHAGETKTETAFDFFHDLWEHDSRTGQWTKVATKGEAPGDRAYHSAVFDEKRNAVWILGGAGRSFEAFDELWKLDVETWTWSRVEPAGERPGARFSAALFHDLERDQLVVWSGCKAFFQPENAWPDVWTFDVESATWSKKVAEAPGRWQAAAVLAPELDLLIVHGGFDGNSVVHADTWTYELAADEWKEIGRGFQATDAHAGVWDPIARQMIVHGGATGGKVGLDELWAFDPKKKKWSELSWKGEDPGARAYHAVVWSPLLQGLWVLGGTRNQFNDESAGNEVWTIALHR